MSEYIEAYSCDVRKARKQHKCVECDGKIEKGENYHYHHGVFDGSGVSIKVCADCQKLRDECDAYRSSGDDPLAFEGLCDEVGELRRTVPELLLRYIAIRRKRGARVSKWMIEFEDAMDVDHFSEVKQ